MKVFNNNADADASPDAIPDFARVALVPIANPSTADDLLRLALSLAHPTDGKVIALIVSLGQAESDAQAIEKLEGIVETLREEGNAISLETIVSTSIARGILDAGREHGTDLIIMGIRHRLRGDVVLGTVVESVLDASPCDILIYRTSATPDYKRVEVPVEPGLQAMVAAKMGIRLARRKNIPVEAVCAHSGRVSQYDGLAQIEAVLQDIPGQKTVKRTVLETANLAEGILNHATKDDLIIAGFTTRSELERWMFGDVSGELLNKARGPVIMVSRAIGGDAAVVRLRRRVINWIRPVLTRVEQDDIVRQSADMAAINIDYATLIVVSATLATLGLLLNSAAVIIGAMLVAPLMSPLIALATGLTVGRVRVARQALSTLLIGMMMAVLVAVVIGVVLPTNTPTVEMLARGNPTLIDAAVALASGVIGAYATARKDIPSALAGVAIAAALMPPVCTIGLGIGFRDADLAYGATLLFLTNIICIILAGIVVFLWLGMSIRRYEEISLRVQVLAIVIFLIVASPVALELTTLTRQADLESTIRQELRDSLYPDELVDMEFIHEDPMRVVAHIRSGQPFTDEDVEQLQIDLAGALGEPVHLELIVQEVIRFSVDPALADDTPEPEATAAPDG